MLWVIMFTIYIIIVIIITLKLIHKQKHTLLNYEFHLFRNISVSSTFDFRLSVIFLLNVEIDSHFTCAKSVIFACI